MMEEENRNTVSLNLVETEFVSPDNGVQLILSKIFSEEDQGRPFMHERLDVIRFYRAGGHSC